MDLAAINIQRGRDHGLPTYTSWRKPCGLSPVKSWQDLTKIMSQETVTRLQSLYENYEDIDLFTGGLAEKPVRGGLVGPTFGCIIAQQFSNLRRADRFWYENGNSEASFTPRQLQEIRKITLSQVLCRTMDEFSTIQPFVFLTPDNFRNERISCSDPIYNSFDLEPWIENPNFNNEIFNKKVSQPPAPENKIGQFLNSIKQKFGFVELKEDRNITHRADSDRYLQATTMKVETKGSGEHGYGSSDWYDEIPLKSKPNKSKIKQKPEQLLAIAPQRDYFTTPSYYGGLQTFQSVANPTRKPPPSSSNPYYDQIDLTYDLTQNKPTPDIEYLIGVVSNDNKRQDHRPLAVQSGYGAPSSSYDQNIKPQFDYYKPTDYYQTTRPYNDYLTTKRYTSRPYNDYVTTKRYTTPSYNDYLTTKRYTTRIPPRPFPTGIPTLSDSPITRPTYRPIIIDNYASDSNYNRPLKRPTTRPPVLQDEDINAVYGQLPNPNFGRPITTRRPAYFDSDNNPNSYGNNMSPIRPSANTPYISAESQTGETEDQPLKLFYIGNVLHKVKDGSIVPVKRYEIVQDQNQRPGYGDSKFVKISSVSGQYASSNGNKNTYINIKHGFSKENREHPVPDASGLVETVVGNLDFDDLEIDESVHLYEAMNNLGSNR